MEFDKKIYDVVLVISKKDISLLKNSIELIKSNLDGNRYICIGCKELKDTVENVFHCVFMDENTIYPQMTLSHIENIIQEKGGNPQRAGWYFQQFLKMAYSYISKTKSYVVWDSDTIPLSHIDYIRDNRYVFMGKKEFHKPYFDVINRIFKGEIYRWNQEISFIAENMIIDCAYMKEMINNINVNSEISGNKFYDIILDAIDEKEISWSGFSEFETYGNYMMVKHPDVYSVIKRKALRIGSYVIGYYPKREQLEWVSKSYEIISVENKTKSKKGEIWATWYSYIYRLDLIRKLISAEKAAQIGIRFLNIQRKLCGFELVDYDI